MLKNFKETIQLESERKDESINKLYMAEVANLVWQCLFEED